MTNLSKDELELLIANKIKSEIKSFVELYFKISSAFVVALTGVCVFIYLQTSMTIAELESSSNNMKAFMEISKFKENRYLKNQTEMNISIKKQQDETRQLFDFIRKNHNFIAE